MAPIEYGKRDEGKGPETYRSQSLLDTIFKATGLENFKGSAVFVDLMSGPGGIALNLQKKAPQHSYAVLDNDKDQLKKIGEQEPVRKILADVRCLSVIVEDGSIDVATVRYGLKDIPKNQQPIALSGINYALKPGGVLVIADMVSPEGAREWNIMQHSRKQQFSGRNIKEEGECYIPTEAEWLKMLREAGFEPEIFDHYKSLVTTTDWVKGKQITDDQRMQMDAFILSAPENIKKEFNIRQEGQDVKIDYPVIIIKAVKKEAKSCLPNEGVLYETK